MSEVIYAGPIAYMAESQATVFFSRSTTAADPFAPSGNVSTAPAIRKLQNAIDVAYWGEDNRFPQNVAAQMDYCSIGKAALDFKARALYGGGIIPGQVTGYDEKSKQEIFEPLDRTKFKVVYNFLEKRSTKRWFLEHSVDWVHFYNCFPEGILSKDAKTFTDIVHQESCDCRYKQMNDKGVIETVYVSKIWGMAKEQYVHFDPKRAIPGLLENLPLPLWVDNKFVKAVDCMDMYNSLPSMKEIALRQRNSRGLSGYKSMILPVNYPSPNKTYYQLASWDGARLSGWVEIASKIPAMLKRMYEKAFMVKYHIEVSEDYFPKKYGVEVWDAMDEGKRKKAHTDLLKDMDKFLSGEENAYKTFISFYDTDPTTKKPYNNVTITPIENKTTIDKDLLISNNAGQQILIATNVPLPIFSGGLNASGGQGAGSGSDIRESWGVYNSTLKLERDIMLDPLYNIAAFNREVGGISEWLEDIQFRIQDTVLTTLDTGADQKKQIQ